MANQPEEPLLEATICRPGGENPTKEYCYQHMDQCYWIQDHPFFYPHCKSRPGFVIYWRARPMFRSNGGYRAPAAGGVAGLRSR